MMMIESLHDARRMLNEGALLAYPTEAVYGLGCDAFNEDAVQRLLALKKRAITKGFIVLIHDWAQLTSLIGDVPASRLKVVRATWPGAVTWVFPQSENIPAYLHGVQQGIAIRMTKHPIARELCLHRPIISTSANQTGYEPVRDLVSLSTQFPTGLDGIVAGALGDATKPTAIFDVLSGAQLR